MKTLVKFSLLRLEMSARKKIYREHKFIGFVALIYTMYQYIARHDALIYHENVLLNILHKIFQDIHVFCKGL